MHYGPPPEPSQPPSGRSTPVSESQKQLSDRPTSWDSGGGWAPGPWGGDGLFKGEQLAPIHFGDGPPWSEDEDLQSPVVVSSRHRKHKSSGAALGNGHGRGRSRNRGDGERTASMLSQENFDHDRGYFVGTRGDGSERYYVNQGDEAGGPGGEIVTYPPEQARHSTLAPYDVPGRRDSHFASTLPSRSYTDETGQDSESDASSSESCPEMTRHDESRYSRDYQFTIASPDEEMHGKAVALFDFQRENENELPLVEGQVIWVSYRHGQGWLVAMDPRTQESGLVPEEYVRLLRDIQGGLNSLTGQANDQMFSPVADSGTPTQAEHNQAFGNAPAPSNGNNEYQQPIVSTFSTSSRDLHPYPQHLLGTQAGQAPPQVIHYHGQRGGSQANTPTLSSSLEGSRDRPTSQEAKLGKSEESSNSTPIAVTLPDGKLEQPSIAVQQPESPDSDTSDESSDEEKDIQSP
jgi:SH3 domain